MRVLLAILVIVSVAAIPVVWQVTTQYTEAQPDTEAEAETDPTPAPTSAATSDLEAQLQTLRAEVLRLQRRIDAIDARTSVIPPPPVPSVEPPSQSEDDTLRDSFAQVVLIGGRRSANEGLRVASPRFLRDMFGLPRADLSDDCQPATNTKLKGLLQTKNVGPIRVRLIRPAIESIERVFQNVEEFEPELYARIKSSGSLCVRFIRGSTTSASAHAYGLAVDINIDGELDNFADGKTQLGLILLADFFKKEGWIWGAGFSREDSMHFEVSRETLLRWRSEGLI